jgi:hypothetical protein
LGLLCDVRVRETVDQVIRKSIEHWGHFDIIAKYAVWLLCIAFVADPTLCIVAQAMVHPLHP